jgi:hypothetical protein
MPHGGRRKGAGRKKGSANKLTAKMKERAMTLGFAALERVGKVSKRTESDTALIRAAALLLNHGFGRPGVADETTTVTPKPRTYRWARHPGEAIPDPARTRQQTPDEKSRQPPQTKAKKKTT